MFIKTCSFHYSFFFCFFLFYFFICISLRWDEKETINTRPAYNILLQFLLCIFTSDFFLSKVNQHAEGTKNYLVNISGGWNKICSVGNLVIYCQLFIDWVKEVFYERKDWGELLGCFFHCTLEWLRPYVFLLQALS